MKLLIKIDDQSFEVEIGDLTARPVLAVVDGETFEVWPEETQAAMPAPAQLTAPIVAAPLPVTPAPLQPAQPTAAANHNKVVAAPIPGTIVGITVKEGDQVKPGQELCSLEAMKMKNAIRANRAGKIARIMVNLGDRVSQGQPMFEYAE